VVFGDPEFGEQVMAAVRQAVFGQAWKPEFAAEIRAMRERLEASRGPRDVKRGPGGQVDIEILVQALVLRFGGDRSEIARPNTWQALDALREAGLIDVADHAALRESYDFLRQVESRLRIMTNRTLDEYPDDPDELAKLARRLGFESAELFQAQLERHTKRTRELFRKYI
jgi:glutamate-ammonia-ligase adenylyltransferase